MPDPFHSDEELDWVARKSLSNVQRRSAAHELQQRNAERQAQAQAAQEAQAKQQEQLERDRVQAEEQAQARRTANMKAAKVEFAHDPTTGKEQPVTHQDGGFKYKPGYQGDPYSDKEQWRVDWRDDRGQVTQTPLAETPEGEFWKVDKDTGQRTYERQDPKTGQTKRFPLGMDPEWQQQKRITDTKTELDRRQADNTQRLAEISFRKTELGSKHGPIYDQESEAQSAWDKHMAGPDNDRDEYVRTADGYKKLLPYDDWYNDPKTGETTSHEAIGDDLEVARASAWIKRKEEIQQRLQSAKDPADEARTRDRVIEAEYLKAKKQQLDIRTEEHEFDRDPQGYLNRRESTEDKPGSEAVYLSGRGAALAQMRSNGEGAEADELDAMYREVINVSLDPDVPVKEVVPLLQGMTSEDGDLELRAFASAAVGQADGQTTLKDLTTKTQRIAGQAAGAKTVNKLNLADPQQRAQAFEQMFGIKSQYAGKFAPALDQEDPSKINIAHEQGWSLGYIERDTGNLIMTFESRGEVPLEVISRMTGRGIPMYYQKGSAASDEDYAGEVDRVRDILYTPANAEELAADQEQYVWAKQNIEPQMKPWSQVEQELEAAGMDAGSIKRGFRQGRYSLGQAQALRELITGGQPVDLGADLSDKAFEAYLERNLVQKRRMATGIDEQMTRVIDEFIDSVASRSSDDVFHSPGYIKARRPQLHDKFNPKSMLGKVASGGVDLGKMVLGSSAGVLAGAGVTGFELARQKWYAITDNDEPLSERAGLQFENTAEATRGFLRNWREDDQTEDISNAVEEIAAWVDSRKDNDLEAPADLATKLKELSLSYQGDDVDPGFTAGVEPSTFDINQDPAMRQALSNYIKTSNPVYIQQLKDLAHENYYTRDLKQRHASYASQASPVDEKFVGKRLKALGFEPSLAKQILAASEHSKKGEKQALKAIKHTAKLLKTSDFDAQRALLLLSADKRLDPKGFFGNAYNAGAADFYEVGTELLVTAATAGTAYLGAKATKAALRGSRLTGGAAGQAVVGRVQQKLLDFNDVLLVRPKLGTPLTKGQKVRNVTLTQLKAGGAASVIEATEEWLQTWKDDGATHSDGFLAALYGAAGGLMMHGFMTPAALISQTDTPGPLLRARRSAQVNQAARLTDIIRTTRPDFEAITADEVEAASSLLSEKNFANNHETIDGLAMRQAAILDEMAAIEKQSEPDSVGGFDELLNGPKLELPKNKKYESLVTELSEVQQQHLLENMRLANREALAIEAIIELRDVQDVPGVGGKDLYRAAAKVAVGNRDFTDAEASAIRNNPAWFSGKGLEAPLAGNLEGATFKAKDGGELELEGRQRAGADLVLSDQGRADIAANAPILGELLQTEASLEMQVEREAAEATRLEAEVKAQQDAAATEVQPTEAEQEAARKKGEEIDGRANATPGTGLDEIYPPTPPGDAIEAGIKKVKTEYPGLGKVYYSDNLPTSWGPERVASVRQKLADSAGAVAAREGIIIDRDQFSKELNQLGPEDRQTRVDAVLREERTHVAQFQAVELRYKKEGRPDESYEAYRDRFGRELWDSFKPEQQEAIAKARQEKLENFDLNDDKIAYELSMEGIRMLVEQRADGTITEETQRLFETVPEKVIKFLEESLRVLRRMVTGGQLTGEVSERVKNEIEAVEAILAENGVKVDDITQQKAAAIQAEVDVSGEAAQLEQSNPKTIETPQGNLKLNVQETVVDWDQLVPAGDPRFPKALQPRDQETQKSAKRIAEIRKKPKASRTAADTATTEDGPPVVTPYRVDGKHVIDDQGRPLYLLLSGNHRTRGIQEAFRDGGPKIEEFNATMTELAGQRGLSTEGIAQPGIVRIYDPGDANLLIKAARTANESSTMRQSRYEVAGSDAEVIGDKNLLRLWRPSPAGDILAESNREFLTRFLKETGATNLVQDDGKFSDDLQPRVSEAMLALVVGPKRRKLLKIAFEQKTSLNIKGQLNGIASQAGNLMQLAKDHPDYSIIPELAEAISTLATYKAQLNAKQIKGLEDYFSQGEMDLGAGRKSRSATADALAISIIEAKSAKGVSQLLGKYAELAGKETEVDMFAGEQKGKTELLREAARPDIESEIRAFEARHGAGNTFLQKVNAGVPLIRKMEESNRAAFQEAIGLEFDRLNASSPLDVVAFDRQANASPAAAAVHQWLADLGEKDAVKGWRKLDDQIKKGATLEEALGQPESSDTLLSSPADPGEPEFDFDSILRSDPALSITNDSVAIGKRQFGKTKDIPEPVFRQALNNAGISNSVYQHLLDQNPGLVTDGKVDRRLLAEASKKPLLQIDLHAGSSSESQGLDDSSPTVEELGHEFETKHGYPAVILRRLALGLGDPDEILQPGARVLTEEGWQRAMGPLLEPHLRLRQALLSDQTILEDAHDYIVKLWWTEEFGLGEQNFAERFASINPDRFQAYGAPGLGHLAIEVRAPDLTEGGAHTGNEDTLGWVRGKVIEHEGQRVLRIDEAQSDAAQGYEPPNKSNYHNQKLEILPPDAPGTPSGFSDWRRGRVQAGTGWQVMWLTELDVKKLQEQGIRHGDKVTARQLEALEDPHPLLAEWERTTLGVALNQAKDLGVEAVFISDANTAMLTEGHYADTSVEEDLIETGFPTLEAAQAKANELNAVPDKDKVKDGALPEYSGKVIPSKGFSVVISQSIPRQAKGMRAAYDQRLPSLISKLTRTKGQRDVDLGEHINASFNVDIYTPEGKPHTGITGRLFPLDDFQTPAILEFGPQAANGEPAGSPGDALRSMPAETARHAELEAKHDAETITPEETAEAGEIVRRAAVEAGYLSQVFYHGAMAGRDFDSFETKYGAYFSTELNYAQRYADPDHPRNEGRPGRLYKAFLKLGNPEKLDGEIEAQRDLFRDRRDPSVDLERRGYDGQLMTYGDGEMEARINRPGQAKSAEPFTGVPLSERFDLSSDSILQSLPGWGVQRPAGVGRQPATKNKDSLHVWTLPKIAPGVARKKEKRITAIDRSLAKENDQGKRKELQSEKRSLAAQIRNNPPSIGKSLDGPRHGGVQGAFTRIDEAKAWLSEDPARIGSNSGYVEYMKRAGVSSKILTPPTMAKLIVEQPEVYAKYLTGGYHGDKTVPGIIESAQSGLDWTVKMRNAIKAHGEIPEWNTLLHHFWGLLSRMMPPVDQEGMWLRLLSQPQFLDVLQHSIDGNYEKWLTETWNSHKKRIEKNTAGLRIDPKTGETREAEKRDAFSEVVVLARDATASTAGLIGNGATANAAALHGMMLAWDGKWSQIGRIYTDNDSATGIGRDFWALGHGAVGIKNKVQRFVGLTYGIPGLIMDRWKFVEMWLPSLMDGTNSATPADFFRYGSQAATAHIPTDPTGIYGSYGVAESENETLSLAFYEAMEMALQAGIDDSVALQTILGDHANVGGLHWVGWNAIKNEAVGHSSLDLSLDLLLRMKRGQQPTAKDVAATIAAGNYWTESINEETGQARRLTLTNGIVGSATPGVEQRVRGVRGDRTIRIRQRRTRRCSGS